MSLNKVILIGRLGRDPDCRFTGSGQAVANFSIATDESWKDKNTGEKVTKTEWHKIVVWRKLAEIVQKYVVKGMLVCVEGKLQTRKWQKEGVDMYTTEIVADNLRMLSGSKREGQAPAAADDFQGHGESTSTPQRAEQGTEITDEDIPF